MAQQFLGLVLVALAYWIAARLSLNLALVHGQVTPIWPPTGIALVALLVVGRRAAPAIAIAAFAVNLPIGPTPLGAALIAIGNTLAPLASAELLRRVGFHLELDRLRDAMALILLAALLGMTISATCGTSVLVLMGAVPAADYWPTWAVWWAGDAMGALLVAPFLLSLLPRSSWRALTPGRWAELGALLVGIGAVTFLLFQNQLRLEYLVLPLIMLAAWRFRLRGAAPAALVASGVAILSAVNGTGPFATETLLQKMVTLQVFNVSVALASFVLAAFVDARDRKEEMSRLYLSAQAASEAKSAFLNMAAHELRTPLSVLAGYLAMMSDGSLGPAPGSWNKPLEILATKTTELNKIVSDLLEASRLEANAMPRSHTAVDIRQAVDVAVERAQPRTELLGGEIAAGPAPSPLIVDGDADQLGRILDNLINNALTYTTRAPRLSITASAEAGQVVVRVADNGVGIVVDERERIFDRFHRSSDPAFRTTSGTGLGLYISRQLAEGHGGSLVVESSDPGNGTVLALALPLPPTTVIEHAEVPAPSAAGRRRSDTPEVARPS